jgi:uncharacterized protein (DUF362 family)
MNKSSQNPPFSRKDFLRLVTTMSTAAAISAFLESCSSLGVTSTQKIPTEKIAEPTSSFITKEPSLIKSPTSTTEIPTEIPPPPTSTQTITPEPTLTTTPTPVDIPEEEMTRVAFVKTSDRKEGVRRAIDMLGINPFDGKQVLVKPNFNSSDPPPASTHPDVLRTVVEKMWEMGAGQISVGDRSGMGSTMRVMTALRVIEMADELGFDVIDFAKLSGNDLVLVKPKGSHWKGGFPIARPCIDAETLVNVCCLKTHGFGGHFTMSLKNAVGMVATSMANSPTQYMDELHGSTFQRLMIAEINTAYTPSLIVLDGSEAFSAGGPAEGRLVTPGIVLVGTDRVAIDAVGVAILRYFKTSSVVAQGPIFQQEQIARAVELGLGVDNPYKIKLITSDAESTASAQEIREILVRQ